MAEEPRSVATRKTAAFSLIPTNFNEAERLAALIAASDFIPKDYKGKPGNVMVAMQMGAEIGLAPLQAVQNIAVINGRPSVWGDAGLAIVQGHKEFQDIIEKFEGTGNALTAVCVLKRKGKEPVERRFGVADAVAAGLWDTREKVTRWKDGQQKEVRNDSPWHRYAKRMLQMRARWWAMRDLFADALKGVQGAEEIIEAEPPTHDMGPADTIPVPQARAPATAPVQEPAKPAPEKQPPAEEPMEEVITDQEREELQARKQHAGTAAEKLAATAERETGRAADTKNGPTLESNAGALRILLSKLKHNAVATDDLCKHFDIQTVNALPMSKINEAFKYVDEKAGNAATED